MKAFTSLGDLARLLLANGARMPSTADDVCADRRSAALRLAEDLRCGFDRESVIHESYASGHSVPIAGRECQLNSSLTLLSDLGCRSDEIASQLLQELAALGPVRVQHRERFAYVTGFRSEIGSRNGYQLVPDVLVRHQTRLGLSCTEMIVLLNILMHWWESEPEHLPHPRPDQIARRMGTSVRTVQRSIEKMGRAGLIEWMPSERNEKGLSIRRFKLEGLLQELQLLIAE